MQREQALSILREHVTSEALIRHCIAVEAAMRHYARLNGEDVDTWGAAGLLHDFDYERYPNPPDHSREGARILRERGVSEEIVGAILSHVPWNQDDYPRDRPMRRALYAVDELCGFIYAVALVRPQRIEGMKPSSVRKKMKQASFAANVSREDIVEGARMLDLDLSTHIQHCIDALTEAADQLGITPPPQ